MFALVKVAKTMFGVAGLVIFAKLIGFVSQVALASKLGISTISDAYFVVLIVPTLLCNVWGGAIGLATASVVTSRNHFGNTNIILLVKAFLWVVPLLILLTIFRSQIAQFFMTEIDAPAKIVVFSELSLVFWPLTGLMCISQIALVWQNATGKLILPALSPLSYAVVIFTMAHFELFNSLEELLINSQLIGVLLEFGVVMFASRRQGLLRFDKTRFAHEWRSVVLLKSSILQNVFSWFILSLSVPVEQYFASMQGPGVNALVGFSGRIVIPLCAILGSALTLVALKGLLDVYECGLIKEFWGRCTKTAILVYVVGGVISWFFSLFSKLLIDFIYTGPSFTANDIALIANLFSWLIYLLPAQLVIMFSYRVFSVSGHGRYQLYLVLLSLSALVCSILFLPTSRSGENIVIASLIANHLLATCYLLLAFNLKRRSYGP